MWHRQWPTDDTKENTLKNTNVNNTFLFRLFRLNEFRLRQTKNETLFWCIFAVNRWSAETNGIFFPHRFENAQWIFCAHKTDYRNTKWNEEKRKNIHVQIFLQCFVALFLFFLFHLRSWRFAAYRWNRQKRLSISFATNQKCEIKKSKHTVCVCDFCCEFVASNAIAKIIECKENRFTNNAI